jgi:hypothetical protein
MGGYSMSLSILANLDRHSVDEWGMSSPRVIIGCCGAPGFAHGFIVLCEIADVLYITTDYYAPEHERCLLWNDREIGIDWPVDREPLLSDKDRSRISFGSAEVSREVVSRRYQRDGKLNVLSARPQFFSEQSFVWRAQY